MAEFRQIARKMLFPAAWSIPRIVFHVSQDRVHPLEVRILTIGVSCNGIHRFVLMEDQNMSKLFHPQTMSNSPQEKVEGEYLKTGFKVFFSNNQS